MISYADTDEMNRIAGEVSEAAGDLEAELNNLFRRLSEVPTGSKEWVGNQAEYYFSRIENDKRDYDQIVRQLRDFSQELGREASSIEASIRENDTAD